MISKWWNESKEDILNFWLTVLWFLLIVSSLVIHGKPIEIVIGFYVTIICSMVQGYSQKILWKISENNSGKVS